MIPGAARLVTVATATVAIAACAVVGARPAVADDYPYDSPQWPALASTWGNQPEHVDSYVSSTWDDGQIMHWSTCGIPIRWSTDSTGIAGSGVDPARVHDLISAALQEASAITGYSFVDAGSIDGTMTAATLPSVDDPPAKSGISFILGSGADSTTSSADYRFPILDGGILGITQQLGATGGLVRSSRIWLDVHEIGPDDTTLRDVITHEIGHALGLDHTDDRSQLMYSSANSVTTFMAGDRHGLSVAAGQPCRFTANVVTIRWVGLSPTRYRISWTKAADFSGTATEYVVQARARGHGWRSIAAHVPAPATSIVWTKARAGTKYQFRVAGIGKGGRGPWSGIA